MIIHLNKPLTLVLRASHHLLELFKIHVTVAVGINISDHFPALTERTLLSQPPHDGVKFLRGDDSVLVEIVHLERFPEFLTVAGAAAVELAELLEINIAVAVAVELRHHAAHLLRRGLGSERRHEVLQFCAGDLAVAVLVELAEDLLYLFVHDYALRESEIEVEEFGSVVSRAL